MSHRLSLDNLQSIPIFALPNVVLFPRAILPLHIFEERYKAMTADVLAANRLIAMALLKPGWEKNYYTRPAIDPVVCVGRIVSYERLADGKFNFLLEGLCRAVVVREVGLQCYRQAQLRLLEQISAPAPSLASLRQRMMHLVHHGPLGELPLARPFRHILRSQMPTADVADLLAFAFLEDVQLKQSLLGDIDVQRRVERAVDALELLDPETDDLSLPLSRFPQTPSMN